MSEPESLSPRVNAPNVPRSGAEDLVPRLSARAAVPEREGLPQNYRMRADAHYVDQLESPAQPVIRMLATRQIDCRDLPDADRVEALTKSIALHGVLQPLMIRRHGGRYGLIAGRRRLAAAMAAGLSEVPCLLHEVDAAGAEAIAAADNLRIADAAATGVAEQDALRPMLQAVTADLSTIRTSTALLRTARIGSTPQQVGIALIEAQAWRTSWLVGAMLGAFDDNRLVSLAAIIQRVSDGFDAQASLTGLQLDVSVTPAAAAWKLPFDAAAAAITGAIFASLSLLDGVAKPLIEVHADATNARTLRIEVVQRLVRVPAHVTARLAADDASGTELVPGLALRQARAVAAPHGGSADLTPLPGVGSVLQLTFASAPTVA